jgi:hypothetical protein
MDFDPKTMVEDYEKLEHVGDGILGEFEMSHLLMGMGPRKGTSADCSGAMITVLLHDLFPLLGEGPATVSFLSAFRCLTWYGPVEEKLTPHRPSKAVW